VASGSSTVVDLFTHHLSANGLSPATATYLFMKIYTPKLPLEEQARYIGGG